MDRSCVFHLSFLHTQFDTERTDGERYKYYQITVVFHMGVEYVLTKMEGGINRRKETL